MKRRAKARNLEARNNMSKKWYSNGMSVRDVSKLKKVRVSILSYRYGIIEDNKMALGLLIGYKGCSPKEHLIDSKKDMAEFAVRWNFRDDISKLSRSVDAYVENGDIRCIGLW